MLNGLKVERKRWTTALLLLFIVAALVLKLVNVFNAPPHWDTNLYLSIVLGYLERGILTPLMWRFNPEWNIVPGAGAGYGVFLIIGWIKLFGFSILSGQVLMYLVGLLNVPVIYLLGKRFYSNPTAGLWAAAAFTLSGMFAQIFYVRMDAPLLLVCSLILLLHLEAVRRGQWWLHFVVGVAMVAAFEVHVLAALYAGGIGLYHAYYYLLALRQEKRLVLRSPAIAFGIGLVLTGALYYVHHVAPHPDIYFEVQRNCSICTERSVGKEFYRWIHYGQEQSAPLMLLFGFAFISACVRRTKRDRDYLLISIGALVALWAINAPVNGNFTGALLILLALGVGGLYVQGLDGKLTGIRGLNIVGVLLLVGALWARTAGTYFTPSYAYYGIDTLRYPENSVMSKDQYRSAIDFIRATVPTDTIILAPEPFFADLIDYKKFMSYYGGEVYGVHIRGETLFDFWQRERPQVFIGDPQPDAQLWEYMAEGSRFVELHPKVWVEKTLVSHLTVGSS